MTKKSQYFESLLASDLEKVTAKKAGVSQSWWNKLTLRQRSHYNRVRDVLEGTDWYPKNPSIMMSTAEKTVLIHNAAWIAASELYNWK